MSYDDLIEVALRRTSKEALKLAKLVGLELPIESTYGVLTVEEVKLGYKKVYVIVRYYKINNEAYRQLLWVEGSVANLTVNEALRKIESLVFENSNDYEELAQLAVRVDEDSLRSRS